MGRRGPTPAPTALKALKGQRIHNKREPQPAPSEYPTPPTTLDERGVALWEELAPDLWDKGVLTTWDRAAFAVWCQAVVTHHEASRDVNERGILVGSDGHGKVKNPALQVARDSATTILQFGARFGLTPSDRQALVMDEGEAEDEARRLLA